MSTHDTFPMGQQIYHRIIWDGRLDESQFEVVYNDRNGPQKRKSVLAWKPDGDIPWHRVVAFEHQGDVVWDRATRLERLDEVMGKKASVEALDAADFKAHQTYRCVAGVWGPDVQTCAARRAPESLTLASWNVLFDLYDDQTIRSARRWVGLMAMLRGLDADVVMLEEVTPAFAEHVLAQPWVQEHYWVSGDATSALIEPYGQMILSKYPFRTHAMRFSTKKRAVLGRIEWSDEQVNLCCVHLTAGRDASPKRAQQLKRLLAQTRQLSNLIIAGDFNLADLEHEDILVNQGLEDMHRVLHPKDAGYTFNPSANALARHNSRSQLDARYDRVLFRTEETLKPQWIRRFGTHPIASELWASDHDGLYATFALHSSAVELTAHAPVVTGACAWVPPADCAQIDSIQKIRAEHDKSFKRWPPHINLLYPFLEEPLARRAAYHLKDAVAQHAPFVVELEEFKTFEHRKSSTVWLSPGSSRPWIALQADMQQQLPHCDQQSTVSSGFTPHLSVAQYRESQRADMREQIKDWAQDWSAPSMMVSDVALMNRRDDEPFEVHHRLPLGTQGGVEGIVYDLTQRARASDVALRVMMHLEDALGANESMKSVVLDTGSTRLGVDVPGSDVDLVVVSYSAASKGLEVLHQALCRHAEFDDPRAVEDAHVPVLKVRYDGHDVDILWAQVDPALSLDVDAWPQAQRQAHAHNHALTGVWLASHLRALTPGVKEGQAMRDAIRVMKAWAQRQGIYGSAWGYWGGVSWSIAVAWVVHTRRQASQAWTTHTILLAVFECLNAWSWPLPLSFDLSQVHALGQASAHMPVLNPLPYVEQNTTRAMTRSTARVMRDAFAAAMPHVERIRQGMASWHVLMQHSAPPRPAGSGVLLRALDEGRMQQIAARVCVALEVLGDVLPLRKAVGPNQWWFGLRAEGALTSKQLQQVVRRLELPEGVTAQAVLNWDR